MTAPSVLRRFRNAPILVVGDVMLDEYIFGVVERISPEAPVPIVRMAKRSHRLGGAANVAANVASLGGMCTTVGLVGQDSAAQELRRLCRERGLTTRGLLPLAGIPTIRKTRVIAQHQQLLRVDAEENHSSAQVGTTLRRRAIRAVAKHSAVVISDYGKGVITEDLVTALISACQHHNVRIIVDPKAGHFPLYTGVDIVTPNHHEAGDACGIPIVDRESLLAAGKRLLEITGSKAVLITRGPEGMSLFRRDHRPVHIATDALEVYDVSGAGDTVVATLALALATGHDLEIASRLANRAAGIVVGKLGTAAVMPQELAASLRKRPLQKPHR
ncbi:D-glycero-beta-D-manno-heptose-7-phosphate kinase [Candidatus Sumerlaeota bacterium]|nr:D-glycero-beta-D-manno-heptose-7-phosphate kinase [Candidatus Sumerlaeota bacterium]